MPLIPLLALKAPVAGGSPVLWIDDMRTARVVPKRMSDEARRIHQAPIASRKAMLVRAVRKHPAEWSLLSVARAWREGSGDAAGFREIARAQVDSSSQFVFSYPLGKRVHTIAQWWAFESGLKTGLFAEPMLPVADAVAPEEICLVLDALLKSSSGIPAARIYATKALAKFGPFPALLAYRARLYAVGISGTVMNGVRRPDLDVKPDLPAAVRDAKEAVRLAPDEPGIAAVAVSVLALAHDAELPRYVKRYASMDDPWTERRERMKRRYPAAFSRR